MERNDSRSDFGGTCDDESDEHGLLVPVEIFEVELILQAHESEREVDGILTCSGQNVSR